MYRIIINFIAYLGGCRLLAKNTLSAYKSDLLLFYEILQEIESLDINDINGCFEKESLLFFLRKMHEKKYQATTINRAIAAIQSFHKFLKGEKILPNDHEILFQRQKPWQKPPEILNYGDINKILSCIDPHDFKGARDYSMIEMLYASGIRASELCNLNENDIREDYIIINGKGSKQRIVPIHSGVRLSLNNYHFYLKKRRLRRKEDAVYVTNKGNRITRMQLWTVVKYYRKKAEIEKNVYPHIFRHSFATHLLENGADIRIIQEILGHSNIATTDTYTHLGMKYITEKFEKCHPRP